MAEFIKSCTDLDLDLGKRKTSKSIHVTITNVNNLDEILPQTMTLRNKEKEKKNKTGLRLFLIHKIIKNQTFIRAGQYRRKIINDWLESSSRERSLDNVRPKQRLERRSDIYIH